MKTGFAALAALLALSACSDVPVEAEPQTAPGRYTLSGAAGQPVPAVVFDDTIRDDSGDFHLRIVATSGTLVLTETGGYEQRLEQTPYIDGQPQPRLRRTDRGAYTVSGDSLHFESSFIQNVRFTAVYRNGEVRVEQDAAETGAATVYRYRR